MKSTSKGACVKLWFNVFFFFFATISNFKAQPSKGSNKNKTNRKKQNTIDFDI